jgi:hypothetical protein
MEDKLLFLCQMLNDIINCDDIGTLTSHREINILFLSFGNLCILVYPIATMVTQNFTNILTSFHNERCAHI